MRRILLILLVIPLFVACAHRAESPPAFTETWHDKSQDAMAEERARKKTQEVLIGEEDDAVTVRADEQGRPKVQVGKDRVHADVDVKGGAPRVRLRYKLKWGHGEKDMPDSIPKLRPEGEAMEGQEPRVSDGGSAEE